MKIISRKDWGARSPRPGRGKQDPHNVREFFVHWPGDGVKSYDNLSPDDERRIMRETQNFHMDTRKWNDFAYGFAIFPSGRVYRGRGMTIVPASQLNHNTSTVSVCVFIGEDQQIPDAVKSSLRELFTWAERRAGHPLRIRPHSAVTPTDCPGPRLRLFVKTI